MADALAVTMTGSATLDLNGYDETIGSLTGASTNFLTLGAGRLTLGVNGTTFAGVISGTGGISVTAGTLTLTGTNTYTGKTVISAGTISITSDASLGDDPGSVVADQLTISNAGALTVDAVSVALIANRGITLSAGIQRFNTANSGSLTVNGVITGSGSINKQNNGSLVLNGANTYTGTTNIPNGTLTIINDASLGTPPGSLTAGRLIIGSAVVPALTITGTTTLHANRGITINSAATISHANALTIAGPIDGTGSLTKTGAGAITLSGSNSYAGATTISAGSLTITDDSCLGAAPGSPTAGHLTLAAAATSLTITGTTTINANRGIALGGTMAITNANAVILAGIIAGSGPLTKNGAGTLTLSGVNSYSGATTISAGTIAIAADSGLGTAPGSATAGHLTLNGGTLSGSAGLSLNSNRGIALGASGGTFNLTGTNSYGGIIAGAGAVTYSIPSGTLTLSGANTYDGLTTISAGTVVAQNSLAFGSTVAGTSVTTTGLIQLNGAFVSGETLLVNPTAAGASVLENVSGFNLWSGTITLAKSAKITATAGTLILSAGVTTSNSGASKTLTFAGAGDVLASGTLADFNVSNALDLAATGTGYLTLSGTNTFLGTVSVASGSLVLIQSATALGAASAGTTVTSGGAIHVQGDYTITEPVSIAGTGTSTAGALRLLSGTTTWSGATTLSGAATICSDTGASLTTGGITGANVALTLAGGGTGTVNGTINVGATGTLDKSGTGSWTLAGSVANSISGVAVAAGTLTYGKTAAVDAAQGTMIVSGGTLRLATTNGQIPDGAGGVNLTGGTFDVNGRTETINALDGSAGIVSLGAGALTVASGTCSAVITGGGTLTKSTTGTLILGGNSTYSGTTTVSAGALQITHANALGTSAAGTTVISGAELQLNATMSLAETITCGGVGVAGVALGAVRVVGTNSVTFTAGLILASNTTLGVPVGATLVTAGISGATFNLTLLDAGDATIGGILGTTTGGLDLTGGGNLTLGGTNTYSGTTSVTNGVLKVTNASGLGTTGGVTSVASGSELQISGTINVPEPITINGSGTAAGGALQVIGSGTTSTLSGTITLGSASSIGVSSGNTAVLSAATGVTGAFALTLTGTGAGSISGQTTSLTGLTKSGTGTWTFSGATDNTTGPVTVSVGVLQFAKTATKNAISGNLTVSGGTAQWAAADQVPDAATLSQTSGTADFGGFNETLATWSFTGGSVANQGTVTLAANAGTLLTLGSSCSLTGPISFSGLATAAIVTSGSGSTQLSGALGLGGTTRTINVNSGTTLTFDGVVSGNANVGLTLATGTGSLVLGGAAANTYPGTTTVTAGTLVLGKSAGVAAVAGDLLVNGGTLDLNDQPQSATVLTFTSGSVTHHGGTLTLSGSASPILTLGSGCSLTGPVALSGIGVGIQKTGASASSLSGALDLGAINRTVDVAGSATLTFSGVVSGSAGLTQQANAGTLVMSGSAANTYSGTTTVTLGTLQLNKSAGNALAGSVIVNGGTLTLLAANQIVDTAALTLTSGILNLGSLAETVASFAFNGGTMGASTADLTLAGTGTVLTVADGKTLAIPVAFTGATSTIVAGGGASGSIISGAVNLGSGTRTWSVGNGAAADDLVLSGVLSGTAPCVQATAGSTISLAGSANKTATGTWSFTAAGILKLNLATDLNGWAGTVDTTGGTLQGFANNQRVETISGTGAIVLTAGSLEIGRGNSDSSHTGVISSTSGVLWKAGSGTLTLGGNSTYATGTVVYGGTLALGSNTCVGSGNLQLENGTSLQATATRTITNAITATGSFTVGGSNALTLGAIAFSPAASSGQTITISNSATTTVSGAISTGGNLTSLTKAGVGTLALTSGSNAFTFPVTVTAGTLSTAGIWPSSTLLLTGGTFDLSPQASATAQSLILAANTHGGNLILNNDTGSSTSLSISAAGSATMTGAISGTANLAFTSGTLILSGTNTYTGTTTISALLQLQGDAGVLTSTSQILLPSGGTLQITNAGTLNPNRLPDGVDVTMSGGLFRMSAPVGTNRSETIGRFYIASGSTSKVRLDANTNANCQVTCSHVTKGIDQTSGGTFTFERISAAGGTASLFSTNGWNNNDTVSFANVANSASGASVSGRYLTASGLINPNTIITSKAAGEWGLTSTWDLNRAPTSTDDVVIQHAVTVNLGQNYPSRTVLFNAGGSLTGTADPTTNSFSLITVNELSVSVAANATVTMDKVQFFDGGNSGDFTINVGSGATLTTTNSIQGHFVKNLVKTGVGTLVWNSVRNFYFGVSDGVYDNGPTTINAGTFVLGTANGRDPGYALSVASGATLDLRNSWSVTALTGAGTITKGSAGMATLTITEGGSWTGVIQDGSGSLAVNFNGVSGTSALWSGTNTFTGGLTVTGGGSFTVSGSGTTIADSCPVTLSIAGSLIFNVAETVGPLTGSGSGGMLLNGTLTVAQGSQSTSFSPVISGAGGLVVTGGGGGALALTGTNSYQGGTTLSSGTVSITSNTNLGADSGSVTFDGGTLSVGGDVNMTNSAIASDVAGTRPTVSMTAASANRSIVVTANDGTITLSSSSLALAAFNTAVGQDLAINGAGGADRALFLVVPGATTATMAGNLTSSGAFGYLCKQGTGSLVLSGTGNTWNKPIVRIEDGTLQLTADGTLGTTSTQVNVLGNGTLDLAGISYSNAIPLSLSGTLASTGTSTWSGSISLTSYSGVPSSTIRVGSGTQTLTGIVSSVSAQPLAKTGGGTLVLANGSNTFDGTTTVSAGILQIGVNAQLGGLTSLVLDGGTLATTGTLTLPATRSITLGTGGGTFAPVASTILGVAGTISGSGTLTKSASGTLVPSGANNYTGDTIVVAGILSIAADSTLGAAPGTPPVADLVLDGGTLSLSANLAVSANRTLTLGASGGTVDVGNGLVSSLDGVLLGTGSLTKTGVGTLSLGGASPSFAGGITVSVGNLAITNGAALGVAGTGTTIASGATLALSGGISSAESLTVTGAGVSSLGAIRSTSGNNTLSGTVELSGATLISSGAGSLSCTGSLSGTANLTIIGAGTVGFSGAGNTFAGLVTVSGGGSLQTGADADLGALGNGLFLNGGTWLIGGTITSNRVITIGSSGGTINLGTSNLDILAFNTATDQSLTLNGTGSLTLNGGTDRVMNGSIGGPATASLIKQGNHVLTLAGNNTFLGPLSINNGTILVTNTAGLGATSQGTTVAAGANVSYAGIGTVAEPLTLAGGSLHKTVVGAADQSGTITLTGASSIQSAGTGVLTVSGPVTGASFALNLQGTSTQANTISGALTVASLIKSQAGTWTLTNASNSWSGDTSVADGTLVAGASGVIPDVSNVVLGASGTPVFALAASVDETVARISTTNTSGSVVLAGGTLTSYTDDTGTFAGGISGNGTVVKNGQGTWVFSGTNTFSGTMSVLGGGTVRILGDSGQFTGVTALAVSGNSTLNITNAGTLNPDRLKDTLVLTLDGGGFSMTAPTGADRTETIGKIVCANSASFITLSASGASNCQLTCSDAVNGLTATGGGTFTLNRNAGTTGTANLFIGNGYADGAQISFGTVSGATAIYRSSPVLQGVVNSARQSIASGAWNISTTWLGGVVPVSSDDVIIGTNHMVTIAAPTTVNTLTFSGGSLASISGSAAFTISAGTVQVNATSATLAVPLAGGGNLVKQGNGILVIDGVSTYTGTTAVNGGSLQVGANGSLATSSRLTIGASGSFSLAGTGRSVTVQELAGSGGIDLGTGNFLVINHATTATPPNYGGVISGAGTSGLTKQGTGIQWLSGANTYPGLTTISNGDLVLTGAGTLGSTAAGTIVQADSALVLDGINEGRLGLRNATVPAAEVITLNGWIFNDSGNNAVQAPITINGIGRIANDLAGAEVLSISGSVSVAGSSDQVILSGASTSTNTVNGVISGSGTVIKQGAGTWQLGGMNTYSGATAVNGGTFSVGAGASTDAASSVQVAEGAVLSGAGSFNGSVVFASTTAATDGSLTPGGSGIGTLNTGALTLGATSPLPFLLSTFSDQVNVNGTLNLAGSLAFSSTSGGPGEGIYTLFSATAVTGVTIDPTSGEISSGITLGTLPNGNNRWLKVAGGNVQLVVDNTPPLINQREALDLNGNGFLDTIRITLNKAVRDSSVSAANFSVSGASGLTFTTTTNGDTANNTVIYLSFTDGVLAGGASPVVGYVRPGAGGAADLAGNLLQSTSGTTVDKALPIITGKTTVDSNGDGFIDGIRLTFSEAVNDASFIATEWTVAGVTVTGKDSGVSGNDNILTVVFTDGILSTAATPTFSYTAGTLADLAGNRLSSISGTPTDGARPVLMSRSTRDLDANGTIDAVVLTYSESVSDVTLPGAATFTVAGVSATSISTGATANDAIIQITMPGTQDTAATPVVVYTPGILADAAGNLVAASSAAATDGAGPVLLTARVNGGGGATSVLVTFSEPVNGNGAANALLASNFTYSGGLTGATAVTGMVEANGSDRVVTVTASPAFALADFNADTIAPASGITDVQGNSAATTSAPIQTGDVTPPTIQTLTTVDVNGDGWVDGVQIVYSEGILDSTVSAAISNGMLGVNVGGIAQTLTFSTGSTADDATVVLQFQDGIHDSGVRPNLTYPSDAVITDASGNRLAVWAVARVAIDAVAPRILSAQSNGTSKQLVVTFSEPVYPKNDGVQNPLLQTAFSYTDGNTGVDSPVLSVSSVLEGDGTDKVVTLTMNAFYLAGDFGADSIRPVATDVFDASGNAANTTAKLVVTTDGLAPTILTVTTLDKNGAANGFIDTVQVQFSKAILDSSVTQGNWSLSGGVTITGMVTGTANDNTVEFTFTDGVLSTSATPTLTYTSGTLKDLSNNLLASVVVTAADGAGPVLLKSETVDLSGNGILAGNGILDGVKLTWSEPLNDATVTGSLGAFTVTGVTTLSFSSTTNGDGANDSVVYLTYPESSQNTAATPTVTYTAGTVSDLVGKAALSYTGTAVDKAAPVLLSVVGLGGGTTLTLTYSEPVSGSSSAAAALLLGGFSYSGGSTGATTVVGVTDTVVGDNQVQLTLNTGLLPGDFGNDTLQTVSGLVFDRATVANGPNTSAVAVSRGDVTAPTLVSALTLDSDGSGFIDKIRLTFSEPVLDSTVSAAVAAHELTLSVGGSEILNISVGTGSTANDAIVELSWTDGIYDTGVRPLVNFTGSASLSDLSGNFLAAFGSAAQVQAQDGAAPRIMSAQSSGTSKQLVVTFSEAVFSQNDGTGDLLQRAFAYTDGNTGADSPVLSVTSVLEGNGSDKVVTLTMNANYLAGDFVADRIRPVATDVFDANGNAANTTEKVVATTDGLAPTILKVETLDENGGTANGFIDTVLVTFSKAILDSSIKTAQWSLSDGVTITGMNSGTANDATIKFTFTDNILNTSATPTLTYTAGTAMDQSNNALASSTVTAKDEAKPVLLSRGTVDLDGNGHIDGVKLTWSEPVSDVTMATATALGDFTIGALTGLKFSSPTGDVADDAVTYVTFPETNLDTAATPVVAFTSGNLTDIAGNKALSASAAPATDTAPPVLLSVVGLGGQSTLTLLFSEPVSKTGATGLALGDLTYSGGLTGATSITAVTDPVVDAQVQVTVNVPLEPGDFGSDTVMAVDGQVFDRAPQANRARVNPMKVEQGDFVAPTMTNGKTLDLNGDGYLDAIEIEFSKPILVSTVQTSDFALSVGSLLPIIASGNTNNTIRLLITDQALDSGTIPVVTYTKGTLSDLTGNLMASASLTPVDKAQPRVLKIISSSQKKYNMAGDTIPIQVVFSEPVVVTNNATLKLALNSGATVDTPTGSGTETLAFTYVVQSHENATRLDVLLGGLTATGGAKVDDSAGNTAVLVVPTADQSGSLKKNNDLVVDTIQPTITNITAVPENIDQNFTYYTGEKITVTVTFSEAVFLDGTATFKVGLDAYDYPELTTKQPVLFTNVQINDTTTASGIYVVAYGERTDNLKCLSTVIDQPAAFHDAAGNSVDVTSFGLGKPIAAQNAIKIINEPPQPVVNNTLLLPVTKAAVLGSTVLKYSDRETKEKPVDDINKGLTYTVVVFPANGELQKRDALDSSWKRMGPQSKDNPNSSPGGNSFTQADLFNSLIQYKNNGTAAGTDSFVFQVSDPGPNSSSTVLTVFNIDISGNAAPVLTGWETPASYIEKADGSLSDKTRLVLAPLVSVTDNDSPNFTGGSIQVTLEGGSPEDQLEIDPESKLVKLETAQVSVLDTAGKFVVVGSGGLLATGTTAWTVNLNADSTPDSVTAIIRSLTYRHLGADPRTKNSRRVKIQVKSGSTGEGDPILYSKDLSIVLANDKPLVGDPVSFGTVPQVANVFTVGAVDPEGGVLTYDITTPPTKGQLVQDPTVKGRFTYTAEAKSSGLDAFVITATDDGQVDEGRKKLTPAFAEKPYQVSITDLKDTSVSESSNLYNLPPVFLSNPPMVTKAGELLFYTPTVTVKGELPNTANQGQFTLSYQLVWPYTDDLRPAFSDTNGSITWVNDGNTKKGVPSEYDYLVFGIQVINTTTAPDPADPNNKKITSQVSAFQPVFIKVGKKPTGTN